MTRHQHLMSDLRVRDLATEREVQALRAENAALREDNRVLRLAMLEQAQLVEEATLVLKGFYRNARKIANDHSDPADDDQAGGRGDPTWPSYQLPSPPPASPYPHPPEEVERR